MRLLPVIVTLLIYTGVQAQTSNSKIAYGDNKAAGHYLHTRGFNMYYEVYGKGEPLLFIHGNGGSMSAFSNNIPCFAKKYMVIAVDSRAHGKSVDPSDSLTFEQMADDFNALLDSLHKDSCYVIGWSDGGINGLLLAIRHPDKVKKLAVTGANLTPDTLGLIPSCYYGIVKTSEELRKKEQTPQVKNALKINDLDLYQPHITPAQLATIQCPTLVIGGDHDLIPVQHTVLIGQSIPKSYIWIIPNSAHATPIDKKEQFNKVVSDFFAQKTWKPTGNDRFE
ncbi:MAG TPA: alpha/beta hydrolase [Chitinophagaceae bacterium]|nr:alpha/beta hydrolase [Chitinophagaceae bacterium]